MNCDTLQSETVAARLRQLKNVCSKSSEDHPTSLSNLFVQENYKIIFCLVPKTASTNWRKILVSLSPKFYHLRPSNITSELLATDEAKKVLKPLDEYKPEEIHDFMNNFTKIMFVRHPFERLLSAYRNKFVKTYTNYFRNRFGKLIVEYLRPNASQEEKNQGIPTFFEFVYYLLNIRYMPFKKNPHWDSINNICSPCTITYDFIGHYETLIEDTNYILDYLRLSDRMLPYSKRKTTEKEWHKEFCNTLHPRLIEELKIFYKKDFELFDYEIANITKEKLCQD